MPAAQKFFHEVVAVVFAQVQYYISEESSIEWYIPFSSCIFNPREVTLILIFSHTNFH